MSEGFDLTRRTRLCPACLDSERETLYDYTTTHCGPQTVWGCLNCGMVYTSVAKSANYENSIYEAPGAIGSGASQYDRVRLDSMAYTLGNYISSKDGRLLDVGCGQGGFLDALRDAGFTRIYGLDPSPICVEATHARGHHATCGFLDERVKGTFDIITLSHVLEHISDCDTFLRSVLSHLTPSGRVYIEVPDAARYRDYSSTLPMLDLNSEHINHFAMNTLMLLLRRSGFDVYMNGFKEILLTSGVKYPAMWCIVERRLSVRAMQEYISRSTATLARANAHIEKELGEEEECIIWGAGEYLCHIAELPVFRHIKIMQIVDRNPALWGKPTAGRVVDQPAHIRRTCPIVVAALVAAPAIRKAVADMGLTNKVIEVFP